MQYNSKSMELTRFILRKGIHSVLGFLNGDSKLFLIQNRVLLMFKIYIHNSRGSEPLKIKSLVREITKVKNMEEKISLSSCSFLNPKLPGSLSFCCVIALEYSLSFSNLSGELSLHPVSIQRKEMKFPLVMFRWAVMSVAQMKKIA